MEVAHIDAFRRDPERFWLFYGDRFASLEHREPNGAHAALVELERRGLLDAVITQNVDRLHAKAGTQELIELHGSIAGSVCLGCGNKFALAEVRERLAEDSRGVPRCDCGEPLKPGVVLFGEFLPENALERAGELAAGADLLLCVGSSLEVYPVAQLPSVTLRAGGDVAIVTQGPTPLDAQATVKLTGDVEDELQALLANL
jgi:NAD-dependent deacetylase